MHDEMIDSSDEVTDEISLGADDTLIPGFPWPECVPKDNDTLFFDLDKFITEEVRRRSRVATNFEDLLQYIRLKLLESQVLIKFVAKTHRTLVPVETVVPVLSTTMTTAEVLVFLGLATKEDIADNKARDKIFKAWYTAYWRFKSLKPDPEPKAPKEPKPPKAPKEPKPPKKVAPKKPSTRKVSAKQAAKLAKKAAAKAVKEAAKLAKKAAKEAAKLAAPKKPPTRKSDPWLPTPVRGTLSKGLNDTAVYDVVDVEKLANIIRTDDSYDLEYNAYQAWEAARKPGYKTTRRKRRFSNHSPISDRPLTEKTVVNMVPAKVTANMFRAYLRQAISNHFANFCRTHYRRHQEQTGDMFGDVGFKNAEGGYDDKWENKLEDKSSERLVEMKMALRTVSKTMSDRGITVAMQDEIFALMDQGSSLATALNKVKLHHSQKRVVLRALTA